MIFVNIDSIVDNEKYKNDERLWKCKKAMQYILSPSRQRLIAIDEIESIKQPYASVKL